MTRSCRRSKLSLTTSLLHRPALDDRARRVSRWLLIHLTPTVRWVVSAVPVLYGSLVSAGADSTYIDVNGARGRRDCESREWYRELKVTKIQIPTRKQR